MGKFDGILICTDLDGTLLKNDRTISQENINAIEFFKSEGGFFTFVTGRMPFFVSNIVERINPNAPFGCINGGGLYDCRKNDYILKTEMSKRVFELVRFVDDNFPDIGIQVNTFDKVYFCKYNQAMEDFRKFTKLENLVCHYSDVSEPVAKIVFSIDNDEDVEGLAEGLRSHPMAHEFDFIQSEKTLYEILPKGSGKGVAIENLCRCLGVDINKSFAIGDYNNDVPMFRTAKFGIAVANACREAIEAADYVTVSNEENAIAKVIYDIDSGIFKF